MPDIHINTNTLVHAICAIDREIKYYQNQLETSDILPYETDIQELLLQLELAAEDLKQAYIKSVDTEGTNNFTYEELIANNKE